MHIVWQSPAGGELWLGSIAAGGQISILLDNGINGLLAASKTLPIAVDSRLETYGAIDVSHLVSKGERGHHVLAAKPVRRCYRMCWINERF